MKGDEDGLGRHEYTSPDEKRSGGVDRRTKHERMTSEIQDERGGETIPRLSHGQKQWLARCGTLAGVLGGLFTSGNAYMEAVDDDERGLLDFKGPDESLVEAFYDMFDHEASMYSSGEILSSYSADLVNHASDPEKMQYVVETLEAGSNLF